MQNTWKISNLKNTFQTNKNKAISNFFSFLELEGWSTDSHAQHSPLGKTQSYFYLANTRLVREVGFVAAVPRRWQTPLLASARLRTAGRVWPWCIFCRRPSPSGSPLPRRSCARRRWCHPARERTRVGEASHGLRGWRRLTVQERRLPEVFSSQVRCCVFQHALQHVLVSRGGWLGARVSKPWINHYKFQSSDIYMHLKSFDIVRWRWRRAKTKMSSCWDTDISCFGHSSCCC